IPLLSVSLAQSTCTFPIRETFGAHLQTNRDLKVPSERPCGRYNMLIRKQKSRRDDLMVDY
ncbi:MAG: hypothetical protein WCP65_06680, partial [Bacteroidota bacterium]